MTGQIAIKPCLAIETGVDLLILDESLKRYVRVPMGTKTADLMYYEWQDYHHFDMAGGRYSLWRTESNRITGDVVGSSYIQI
jgi:hypothetical protein